MWFCSIQFMVWNTGIANKITLIGKHANTLPLKISDTITFFGFLTIKKLKLRVPNPSQVLNHRDPTHRINYVWIKTWILDRETLAWKIVSTCGVRLKSRWAYLHHHREKTKQRNLTRRIAPLKITKKLTVYMLFLSNKTAAQRGNRMFRAIKFIFWSDKNYVNPTKLNDSTKNSKVDLNSNWSKDYWCNTMLWMAKTWTKSFVWRQMC